MFHNFPKDNYKQLALELGFKELMEEGMEKFYVALEEEHAIVGRNSLEYLYALRVDATEERAYRWKKDFEIKTIEGLHEELCLKEAYAEKARREATK